MEDLLKCCIEVLTINIRQHGLHSPPDIFGNALVSVDVLRMAVIDSNLSSVASHKVYYKVKILICNLLRQAVLKIGIDQWIKIAVEHGVGVRGFVAGAQIFDLLVGVQHVAANLIAPLG